MIENKKIFVLGMARSGYEVAKLLSSKNDITICDSKKQGENELKELERLGIKFIETNEPESLFDESYDILIKNPAVFPYNACVVKAKNLNIPVVNEMEVAFHYINKPVKIIGVTGSNGKTTTTTLIYEVLKRAGKKVKLAGNIGTPLSKIVCDINEGDILLLEISDHQLIDFKDFKTDISVLTNLCPTHLDYHGSYESYKNVKHKIFNHHTNTDIAIINKSNYDSLSLTNDILSTKKYFNNDTNYIKNNNIYLNNKPILNIEDIVLRGIHNYENILAMMLVMETLNIDFKYAYEVLKEFKGVEHRLEYVTTKNGVKYYNDSKSTNPTSTVTALKSFDGNIHLILGGMERSQDFNELNPYLPKVKKIYAIGEVRNRIVEYANLNNIPCESYETLKEAMAVILLNTTSGDTVLLSPGGASWDQYAKFEDRGQEFKDLLKD